MKYTICVINDKRVVKRVKDYNFATIEGANRFAEGMVIGMWATNKCWSVVLIKDDILNNNTMITKDLTPKRMALLMREYRLEA